MTSKKPQEQASKSNYKSRGYQKLAYMMGKDPEVAIFRKFGWMSTLALMKLQAELAEKERELQQHQQKDEQNSSNPYPTSFKIGYGESKPRQFEILEESEKLLRAYNELLLQTAQVSNLGEPSSENLKVLHRWLELEKGGNNFQSGNELLRTWAKSFDRDLIGLRQPDNFNADISQRFRPWVVEIYDFITRNLPIEWVKLRRAKKQLDPEAGDVYDYSDSKLLFSTKWALAAVLTSAISLLPALVILWLNSVATTNVRIYITIGMTGGLGLLMKIITDANMKEILAVTVAFAAVEVVFIGSAAGGGAT